jgi:hypothetical protein
MSAGTPVPPNPAYQNVPPQPPKSSGSPVVKIILIVVGVFVFLGVVGAAFIGFGLYKVSKSVHADGNGNVSISTPGGTISTSKNSNISAADLGTDPYPGATSGDGSMNMKTPGGSMVTAVYNSTDSADKIVAFYKAKLGDQASIVQTNDGTVLSSGDKDKENIVITITPQGSSSKIAIIHVTNTKDGQ